MRFFAVVTPGLQLASFVACFLCPMQAPTFRIGLEVPFWFFLHLLGTLCASTSGSAQVRFKLTTIENAGIMASSDLI